MENGDRLYFEEKFKNIDDRWKSHDDNAGEFRSDIKQKFLVIAEKMTCGVHAEKLHGLSKAIDGKVAAVYATITILAAIYLVGFGFLLRKI